MSANRVWRAAALLAVTAALAAPAAARAQSAMGVRSGMRWAELDAGADVEGGTSHFVLGGYFGFGISDRLALQFEAVYGGRGAEGVAFPDTAGGSTVMAGLEMQYIDVPILLRAGFPTGRLLPSVFVGPYFGFLLSCERTPEGGETRDCDAEDGEMAAFDPRATDIGLVAGGALDLLLGESTVFIDARYTAGLLPIESGDGAMDARHSGLEISAGFAFPLGR